MSDYRKLEQVKQSLYDHVKGKIPTETHQDYIVGDGASNLGFYFSFPSGPEITDFHMPSISIDATLCDAYEEYDLGGEARYPFNFSIDVFARDNAERDYLAGVITDILKNYSVPYNDYNADGVCVGYIRNSKINSQPVRVVTPSLEEEYRYVVNFTTTLLDNY